MSDPSSIYTQAVMQRLKALRHQGPLACEARTSRRVNPLCGDTVTVHVAHINQAWRVSFEGYGCALCMVAADMMAQAMDGASTARVGAILQSMEVGDAPDDLSAHLLTLEARRACVMLPWNILRELVCSTVDSLASLQGDKS